MNHIFFYLLATFFSSLHSMNHIWIKTNDNHTIPVHEAIAQQSNVLTVLQEKYDATQKKPIPIPLSKEQFDTFCRQLPISPQKLITTLSNNDYNQLMNIATALKCPLFYAQLIEQLYPNLDIIKKFVRALINIRALKKTIHRHFLEKICLKKSKYHFYDYKPFCVAYSPDGHYFAESISEHTAHNQIHLWHIDVLADKKIHCKRIKLLNKHNRALFSPSGNYLLAYSLKGDNHAVKTASCLYSIIDDKEIILPANYSTNPWITLFIHPNGEYIIQTFQESTSHTSILYHYNQKENTITKKSLGKAKSAIGICFHPDGKHIVYVMDKKLVKKEIENPAHTRLIYENIENCSSFQVIQNNALLYIYLIYAKHAHILTLKNDAVLSSEIIKTDDSYYGLKNVGILSNKMMCWNSDRQALCFRNEKKEEVVVEIKSHDYVSNIVANISESQILSVHKKRGEISSALILWNISDIVPATHHVKAFSMTINDDIDLAKFSHTGLLLTQSKRKIELWDQQYKILSLGHPNAFAEHPHNDFLLTVKYIQGTYYHQGAETKLYFSRLNTDKAQKSLSFAMDNLTLSQAFLFNTYYKHRKDKHLIPLYPNMPDGRALAALQEKKLGFLVNCQHEKTLFT